MSELKDSIGTVSHGWEVLEIVKRSRNNGLLARHGCGSTKVFRSAKDHRENSQKCGHCSKSETTPLEKVYKIYQQNAAERHLPFELGPVKFAELIRGDCFYCGAKPSTLEKGRWVHQVLHEDFYRNGIDRLDSEFGYTASNCVPCCFPCNKLKGNMSLDDFVNTIRSIHQNLFTPKSLWH